MSIYQRPMSENQGATLASHDPPPYLEEESAKSIRLPPNVRYRQYKLVATHIFWADSVINGHLWSVLLF